jgi:hypothetical protein
LGFFFFIASDQYQKKKKYEKSEHGIKIADENDYTMLANAARVSSYGRIQPSF